jgi:cytochrome c-type biogenesis protein
MVDPAVPVVFLAGLISFLSPCVLPLVPGYLSYMSGVSAGNESSRTIAPVLVALVFVLGFSLVFIAFGLSATALGSYLRVNKELFARIGGVFIIFMGLVFMGAIKVPFLYREARFHPTPEAGLWGSLVLGGAFAFGWTPCIGATLGPVLGMAAGRGATGSVAQGGMLLGVYSLGLGVPFILSGLGVAKLTNFLTWFRRHIRTVNLVSGGIMVIVGLLFVTNQIFRISIWLQRNVSAIEGLWTF